MHRAYFGNLQAARVSLGSTLHSTVRLSSLLYPVKTNITRHVIKWDIIFLTYIVLMLLELEPPMQGVNAYPYVAMINPMTGREVWSKTGFMDAHSLTEV